jgi:hypothetical protein
MLQIIAMKFEGVKSMVAHKTFNSEANFQARMTVDQELVATLML